MAIGGRRRLVKVFPDPVQELWDKWELRVLVFVSLASQILLTLLGNRRKFRTKKVTKLTVWCAYLLAENVPTIALGVISSKVGDYYDQHGEKIEDPQLIAFWAPFFLMHIGGPDTITALSLEDIGLWLRHSVGLVFRTLLTVYIILLSWNSNSWLSYLSVPMLIIGFIKYGERTWCLYSASSNYDGDFQLSSFVSKSEELTEEEIDFNFQIEFKAYMVSIFSDMVFPTNYIASIKEQLLSMDYEVAFVQTDAIHDAVYDALYTKAIVANGIWGCISRLVISLTLVVVLTLHIIFSSKNDKYSREDRIITFILLVGAIISEIVSTILLAVSSGWTYVFLHNIKATSSPFMRRIVSWFVAQSLKKRSWWNSTAQCNLLSFLLLEKNRIKVSGTSSSITKLEKHFNIACDPISPDLKKILFDNVKKKLKESIPIQSQRGPRYQELVKAQKLHRRRMIIENLEFHQSILLWHIVTDLCYYCDDNRDVPESAVNSSESKKLSDYMFYLLVKQRHMLPLGTGLPSLRDTLVEATKYCEQPQMSTLPSNASEACKILLQEIMKDTEYVGNHPRGRSVFRYAFVTAHDLLSRGDMKQIWEFLIELWIEMLNYGAAHCRVDRHSQQLTNGGEFITHVWILQLRAGLLEQFQITRPFIEDENNVGEEIP